MSFQILFKLLYGGAETFFTRELLELLVKFQRDLEKRVWKDFNESTVNKIGKKEAKPRVELGSKDSKSYVLPLHHSAH